MKKLLLLTCLFISINCYALILQCPATLTCDYQKATCDTPSNFLLNSDSARESFTLLTIPASSMVGIISQQGYSIYCSYMYGTHSSFTLYSAASKPLIGNGWIYSGFGNKRADCSDISNLQNCQFKLAQ